VGVDHLALARAAATGSRGPTTGDVANDSRDDDGSCIIDNEGKLRSKEKGGLGTIGSCADII